MHFKFFNITKMDLNLYLFMFEAKTVYVKVVADMETFPTVYYYMGVLVGFMTLLSRF